MQEKQVEGAAWKADWNLKNGQAESGRKVVPTEKSGKNKAERGRNGKGMSSMYEETKLVRTRNEPCSHR